MKHLNKFNENSFSLSDLSKSDEKTYTAKEVNDIIKILLNHKNITHSLSTGSNSIRRFLLNFNNGEYDKYK